MFRVYCVLIGIGVSVYCNAAQHCPEEQCPKKKHTLRSIADSIKIREGGFFSGSPPFLVRRGSSSNSPLANNENKTRYTISLAPSSTNLMNMIQQHSPHSPLGRQGSVKSTMRPLASSATNVAKGSRVARSKSYHSSALLSSRSASNYDEEKEYSPNTRTLLYALDLWNDAYRQDDSGRTPLMDYILKGDIENVKRILKFDSSGFEKWDYEGNTAIALAAKENQVNTIRALLSFSPKNLSHKNLFGNTAALCALLSECSDGAREIFQYEPARIDDCNDEKETALHIAARKGDAAAISMVLSFKPKNIYSKDKAGSTPLRIAITKGCIGGIRALLEYDASKINKQSAFGRVVLSTALHELNKSQDTYERIALMLLRYKASPYIPDKLGKTPLMYAAEFGIEAIVTAMLDRSLSGMLIEEPRKRQNALLLAAHANRMGVVALLISKYAKSKYLEQIYQKDAHGYDALMYVALHGDAYTARYILTINPQGINNQDDSDKKTPLMLSAENMHVKCVKELLAFKPDLTLKDAKGKDVYELIAEEIEYCKCYQKEPSRERRYTKIQSQLQKKKAMALPLPLEEEICDVDENTIE